MSNQSFNGIDYAEEIFFVSKLDVQETCERIRSKVGELCPVGYIDTSIGRARVLYTKRRLFICEYHVHCDISCNENKYRLQLFYSTESTSWVYWLSVILYFVLLGRPILNSSGDDTTNMLVFFGALAFVLWITYRLVQTNPERELFESCKFIKRELEAYIKLELE